MTPEQYQKCTAAFDDYKLSLRMGQQPVEWSLFKAGYEACIANGFPVPEGYFHIGEEVDFRWTGGAGVIYRSWTEGQIQLVDRSGGHIHNAKEYEVRRRPAWKPKDGEAVFVVRGEDTDVSVCRFSHIDEAGIWRVVTVKGQEQGFTDSLVKPFDASKIGKPWSEL